jgi:hypothetical protein
MTTRPTPRWSLRALAAALVIAGCLGFAPARAAAQAVCDPSTQDCGPLQYAFALTLFATLNADIALYPPSPSKDTTLQMATLAESLYPPVPFRPSDFCPSHGAFGALLNYTAALLKAPFPPTPALVAVQNDTIAIRTEPIWTYYASTGAFPPNPCIGS